MLSTLNDFRAPWSQTGQVPVLRPDLTLRQQDLTLLGPGPARHPPDLSLLTPSTPSWEEQEDDLSPGPPPGPPPPSATPCPPHLRATPAPRLPSGGRDPSTWLGLRKRLMNCRLCTRSARSGWSRNPDLSSGSPWPRDSVRRVTTWRPRERRGYRRTPTRDSWSLVSSRSLLRTLTPCPPAPPCLMLGQSLNPSHNSSLTLLLYSGTSILSASSDTLLELEAQKTTWRFLERLMRTVVTENTRFCPPLTQLTTDSNQLNNPRYNSDAGQ